MTVMTIQVMVLYWLSTVLKVSLQCLTMSHFTLESAMLGGAVTWAFGCPIGRLTNRKPNHCISPVVSFFTVRGKGKNKTELSQWNIRNLLATLLTKRWYKSRCIFLKLCISFLQSWTKQTPLLSRNLWQWKPPTHSIVFPTRYDILLVAVKCSVHSQILQKGKQDIDRFLCNNVAELQVS